MHFFLQSLRALANLRPEWHFRVIGSIALTQLSEIKLNNIEVIYWDNDFFNQSVFSFCKSWIKWVGKEMDTGFIIQSRFEYAGLPWGKGNRIKENLSDCDIIWVPFYNIALNNLALIEHLKGISLPVLATIHDIHPSFYPEDHTATALANYHQGFVPFIKECHTIITHSVFQKQAIIQHLELAPDKIRVTPQPPLIEPEKFSILCNENDAKLILRKFQINSPYAFYPASTLHVHKNHSRLLIAWSELKNILRDECPMLVCTGKGSRTQWKRIEALIDRLSLNKHVVFTGTVDLKTLVGLFRSCDMVVLPTLFEGAGSGILTDACMQGKPVISSYIPQILEQVKSLGNIHVEFFDGNSVPSIVNGVYTSWKNINSISETALQNKSIVTQNFQDYWDNWCKVYIDTIEEIV